MNVIFLSKLGVCSVKKTMLKTNDDDDNGNQHDDEIFNSKIMPNDTVYGVTVDSYHT